MTPRTPSPSDLALASDLVRRGRLDESRARLALSELASRLSRGENLTLEALIRSSAELSRSLETVALRPPQPGERFGRYAVLSILGKGGMGAVYRARDEQLGRQVAIKVLLELEDLELRERFAREARSVATLRHTGIVALLDAGEVGGVPYLAFELVEGENLASAIKRGLEPREAARILAEVAVAVAHAHAAGIVHRDLKPANVLLERDGRARVADFGLARAVNDAAKGLSASGQLLGTPAYMAPEQAHGESASELSDVYALGAVLYEMLTGKPPHEGATPANILFSVVTKEPPSPRSQRPKLHQDLETICLKALEKDASRRYQSADALALDLERFLAGEEIEARPASALEKLWRQSASPRVAALGVVVFLATICGIVGVVAVKRARERDAAREKLASEERDQKAAEARALALRALHEKLERELEPEKLVGLATAELDALTREPKRYTDSVGTDEKTLKTFFLDRRLTARQRLTELKGRSGHVDADLGRAIDDDARALLAIDPAHAPRWRFAIALYARFDAPDYGELERLSIDDREGAYGQYSAARLAAHEHRPDQTATLRLVLRHTDPGTLDVRILAATALNAMRSFEESAEAMSAIVGQDPRPRCEYLERELWSYRSLLEARRLIQAGSNLEALEILDRILAENPGDEHALPLAINLLTELHRFDEALGLYKGAVAINHDTIDIDVAGAIALGRTGKAEEALAILDKVLARQSRAQPWAARSTLLATLNRMDEALTSAEKAVALEPNLPHALYAHARALAGVGRLAEAKVECEKVRRTGGEHGPYARSTSLLETLIDRGLLEEKEDHKTHVIRSIPQGQ